MNYHPHSPLPGNPTPPITPGAVQPPYPGQMGIKKGISYVSLLCLSSHINISIIICIAELLYINQ